MSHLQRVDAENVLIARSLLILGTATLGVSQCVYICGLLEVSNLCRSVIESSGQHLGLLFFTLPALAFVTADISNHIAQTSKKNLRLFKLFASSGREPSIAVSEAYYV